MSAHSRALEVVGKPPAHPRDCSPAGAHLAWKNARRLVYGRGPCAVSRTADYERRLEIYRTGVRCPERQWLVGGWIEFSCPPTAATGRFARRVRQLSRTGGMRNTGPRGLRPSIWKGTGTCAESTGSEGGCPPKAMFKWAGSRRLVHDRTPAGHGAVLDPFSVYEKGEKLLRQEYGRPRRVAPGEYRPRLPSER